MIFILLMFLSALLLSGISEYYSIVGLTAIFSGAPAISIYLMGGALGFGKLMNASWLYRNWKTGPFLLKAYLTISLVILMTITSMGIFGYLAKAHIDSTLNFGQSNIEVSVLDQQESILKDRLKYLLARAGDPGTASRKIDVQIQDTQKQLSELQEKKLPVLKEQNKQAADVGPVKYVADMIYGNDPSGIDKAVRLVIIIIMLVFDPLAVLSLVAGNISLKNWLEERKNAKPSTNHQGRTPEMPTTDKQDVEVAPSSPEQPILKNERARQPEVLQPIQEDAKKSSVLSVPRDNIQTLYDFDEPYSFKPKE